MDRSKILLSRSMRLQNVPRWVVVPVIRRQSVAEHTLNCLAIYQWLCEVAGLELDLGTFVSILEHDEYEAVEGDRPSPSKNPKTKQVSRTRVIVKIVDMLEALHYGWTENLLGNKHFDSSGHIMTDIVDKLGHWLSYGVLGELTDPHELALMLYMDSAPNQHPGMADDAGMEIADA